jgi:hypothetical protein
MYKGIHLVRQHFTNWIVTSQDSALDSVGCGSCARETPPAAQAADITQLTSARIHDFQARVLRAPVKGHCTLQFLSMVSPAPLL